MDNNSKELANKLWNEVIDRISKDIDCVVFIDVWLKPLEPLYIKDNTLYLAAITKANIEEVTKLMPAITNVLQEIGTTVYTIQLLIDDGSMDKDSIQLPESFSLATVEPQEQKDPMFNSRYSFENFVVGNSNQHVHAAARNVADNPGINFNPLFIYGGVGLGKTHLMQAIGNHLIKHSPHLKVMYVASDKFMNDFIESIHSQSTTNNSSFRQKYREVDVLMIDDIQYFSKNAERTQEEFFHTFNTLYNQNKQIIISSDRHPNELVTLVERLRSRFKSGLIVDIKAPDMETKIAILKKKSQIKKCNINNDVLTYIAENSSNNVRDMEGNLNSVIFFASLNNTIIDLQLAAEALKYNAENKKEALNIDNIIDIVCDYYTVSKDDLLGKKKNKEIVDPRQVCIYLITEYMSLPLSTIAEKFNRDHTTIMHSRDKISEKVVTNSNISLAIKNLRATINNE